MPKAPALPREGTLKRWVYDQLDYRSGTAVRDLTNWKRSYNQVRGALGGLEMDGIVEKVVTRQGWRRETLWFLVGDSPDNNPFTHPPDK